MSVIICLSARTIVQERALPGHFSGSWQRHLYIKQKLLVCLYVHCHFSADLGPFWLLKIMTSLEAGIKEMSLPSGETRGCLINGFMF